MSPKTRCPDAEVLERYVLGECPAAEAAVVEEHLPQCPRCRGAADALEADAARLAAAAEPTTAPWLPAFVAEAAAASSARPVGLTVPGYELLDELGRGGMGVVYKARQTKLQRLVALKMIRSGAQADESEVARFRAEAEAVARLQHPNIVQIYEVGEYEGQPYLSLEFVAGGTLARRLAKAPQNARTAAAVLETLARAMHVAHQSDIIHRDLKPANVLLAGEPELPLADCTPKITDFGLAKRLDKELGHSVTGQVMGTPSYMAPEQAQGKVRAIGPAADVYALGAMLYEMLTARPPFQAETVIDALLQVINHEPVPPRRLAPKVPRDLETICLKCLEKSPARRYDSALALADDLHRFLAGEPIRARPTGVWERGRKWARRRPVSAALVAVSALALVSSVSGLLGYFDHRRQVAEQGLNEERRVGGVRTSVGVALATGEAALPNRNWQVAASEAGNALILIDQEKPRLEEHRGRAEALKRQANSGAEADAEKERIRGKYPRLMEGLTTALVYESQFTGRELAANQAATRVAARAALDAFREGGDFPAVLRRDAAHFNDRESEEITASLYGLLLILAEAVRQPLASENPAAQARDALAVLDQAAELRRPTRAFHLRRAACLAGLDDRAADGARELARGLSPADPTDFFLLGDDCYKRRDLPGAVGYFQETLRRQSSHFWARYYFAVCYLQTKRYAEAEICLTACQNQQPDLVWVYILRGFAAAELGARAPAEAAAKQFQAAEDDFRKALGLNPNEEAAYALAVNLGVAHILQRRYEEAAGDLRAAIATSPRESLAYANLARVYVELRDWDKAAFQLTAAIERQPDLAAFYRERALVHLEGKHLDAALADFNAAARYEVPGSPALARHHAWRGRVLYFQERSEDALQAYDIALRIDPSCAEAHHWRGVILMDRGQSQKAILDFDAYLKAGPPSADVYELRGLARHRLHDYAEASIDYSRALELRPQSVRPHSERGWVYLAAGAPRAALRDFDQVLALEKQSADGHAGRGYAEVQLGRVAEALRDAEQAVEFGPARESVKPAEKARLAYNVARIYARATGQVEAGEVRFAYQERAVTLLRTALVLTPEAERPRFWKDYVLAEVALEPVTRSLSFARLAGEYGRGAGQR
jgi:serine/threonine protein kinase/tetratricopeptide (TPR) repeat protein